MYHISIARNEWLFNEENVLRYATGKSACRVPYILLIYFTNAHSSVTNRKHFSSIKSHSLCDIEIGYRLNHGPYANTKMSLCSFALCMFVSPDCTKQNRRYGEIVCVYMIAAMRETNTNNELLLSPGVYVKQIDLMTPKLTLHRTHEMQRLFSLFLSLLSFSAVSLPHYRCCTLFPQFYIVPLSLCLCVCMYVCVLTSYTELLD